jgi:hypothetical protein
LNAVVQSRAEYALRVALYQRLYDESPDTWDFQWGYAKLSQGMLSVVPCRNLIENIGFAGGGTHHEPGAQFGLDRLQLAFPLTHPDFVLPDIFFDRAYSRAFTSSSSPPLWRKVARKMKKSFSMPRVARQP